MRLKEKNNMTKLVSFCLLIVSLLCGCGSLENKGKELTDEEKARKDSISKAEQKMVVDSMKKKNPLLIMPPDSDYTGSYIDKYPSGIKKFTGFFRFGQRHGQWLSFYPNGMMWSEMHYDKGLREGPNKTFFEDGKMRYEGFYKNDKRDSIWCYYDSLGKPARKLLFKNDKVVKELPTK
jgi:antitoxin component YwqK of YwqJK toxin-antitoxin module